MVKLDYLYGEKPHGSGRTRVYSAVTDHSVDENFVQS